MASWQAHLTAFVLKHRVKNRLRGDMDIQAARQAAAGAAKPRNVPQVTVTEAAVGGIPGEWLRSVAAPPRGTLLNLHGGGYFACSPATHRPITGGFARRGFHVFAPDYRLAPEHPFPAAVEDAVAAYRGLLDGGVAANRLTVAGDSAGGGLALAMLVALRDAGIPLPAAAALFSPWTDLAGTGASLKTNNRRDAMFRGDMIAQGAKPYLAGQDPHNPLASPLYADLRALPPLLFHVGSYEVLLDDSLRLATRAREAGVSATVRTWPVVPHVWQLFPIPEARASLDGAAEFLHAAVAALAKPMVA